MPRMPPRYNFGSEVQNSNPVLYNQLSDLYTLIANILNTKTSKNVTNVAPPANDQINANYDVGDIWVDTSTDTAYIMTSRTTSTAVTWTAV